MMPRRFIMAIGAVVDVATHARGEPVAARALAVRHGLSPRHLEPLLQDLVRSGILKGLRGPRGGYELARERRRVSAGDIIRAVGGETEVASAHQGLIGDVIEPAVAEAVASCMATLDKLTVAELCRRAGDAPGGGSEPVRGEFHI